MLYYLQDCSKSTPIGQLPSIINHNNEAIANQFNWIYDSSMNRLTKSVYAPTGTVTAHFGEFVNLSVEYITIKNVDSLKNSIQKAVDDVIASDIDEHNVLNGRFSTSTYEKMAEDTSFCHDTRGIITEDGIDLQSTLDIHHDEIEELYNNDIIQNNSIGILNTSVNLLEEGFDTYKANVDASLQNIDSSIESVLDVISEQYEELNDRIDSEVESIDASIEALDASIKECVYTAGSNIEIKNNVITAKGYTFDGETCVINNNLFVDNNMVGTNCGIVAEGAIVTNDDIAFVVDGSTYTGAELVYEIKSLRESLADMTTKYNNVSKQLISINAAIEDIYTRLDGVAAHANTMLSYQTNDNTPLNTIDYEDETIAQAEDLATKING